MKVLSLKLREDVFDETESVVKKIHIPRNAYINQALVVYNQLNKRRLLKKKLVQESRMVRSVSMDILKEMEKLEDGLN